MKGLTKEEILLEEEIVLKIGQFIEGEL